MTDTENIKLSEKQQKVVDAVLKEKKSVFFTGAAGTGKSFLMNYIIKQLRTIYSPYQIGVTASTGIAAINIGGYTLHAFLGLGLANENIKILKEKVNRFKKVKNRWNNTKVLIIDEISMIDLEFFEKVETIARYIRNNNMPFGGIQVIATGDFYQLPPVKSNKFCFESKSWDLVFNTMIELTEIYRQKDFKFKKILNEIRYGKISKETETEIENLERPIQCPPDMEPTHLYSLRAEVEEENRRRLDELDGEPKIFYSTDTGDEKYMEKLDNSCPAQKELRLKINAQVCLVRNLDLSLINGSLGIVKGFNESGNPVVFFLP